MKELLFYLREFHFASIFLRLILSLLFGGLIGLERGSRHKAAGFRTYMLVCLGATLTMLLGQYQSHMLDSLWSASAAVVGTRTDITRFSAQVINGIGFLGAGTIIVTGHQAVKGLTTAAALWASACMGLVIGAGYGNHYYSESDSLRHTITQVSRSILDVDLQYLIESRLPAVQE